MSPTHPSISHSLHHSAQNRQTLLAHARLLHLLHHRNKNQHRRSIWYRHFNSFRREVHQLCVELGLSLTPHLEGGSGQLVHSDPPRRHNNTIIEEKKQEREYTKKGELAVNRRLLNWRDSVLLVQWYSAFSHLPSTPHSSQFAPLGLVLLAILGRVTNLTGLTASLERLGDDQEEFDAEKVRMAIEQFGEEVGVLMGEDRDSRSLDATQKNQDQSTEDLGVPIAYEDG